MFFKTQKDVDKWADEWSQIIKDRDKAIKKLSEENHDLDWFLSGEDKRKFTGIIHLIK